MLHFQIMQPIRLLIILFFTSIMSCYGFHQQFVNLQHAEQLYNRQMVSSISHRFLGVPLKDNGLLGQDIGANVAYGVRVGLGHNQVLSYMASSAYSQSSLMYKMCRQLSANQWYGVSVHVDQLTLSTDENTTPSVTLFTGIASDKLDVVFNLIYKDYFSAVQVGAGLGWQVVAKTKLSFEYVSPIESYASKGVLSIAAKIMTFGHNFYVFLSNQNDVGFIPATSGTESDQYYAGFRIERIFDF